MLKLLPVLLFGLIMAYVSERKSEKIIGDHGEREYFYKEFFYYLVLTVVLAVFVGLRTRGNDTYAYRIMFERLPVGFENIKYINWISLGNAPAHQAVNIILKTLGCSTQDYFMIYALFTVSVYMWFVRKYTNNMFFSVFLVFTMGVYVFTMAAIKQTAAVAILLIATDKVIQKRYIPFGILVYIAMLFHPYSFVYIVIPFLDFKPWTRRTAFFMAGTAVFAIAFTYFLGPILTITDMIGKGYTAETLTQEGVNIFRVLVVWSPVVISFFVRGWFQERNDRKVNIVINATMINALIMFLGLFGTANYFARLANYFLIFQAISLPVILDGYDRQTRFTISVCAVAGYSLYFLYENILAYGSFDSIYDFMPFFSYLKDLILR